MSTRSQLRFVERIDGDDEQANDRIAQIYRHSDGYPRGVLGDLLRLKGLLNATGTQRDAAYTAAQFILVDTLSTMELYVDEGRDRSIHASQRQGTSRQRLSGRITKHSMNSLSRLAR